MSNLNLTLLATELDFLRSQIAQNIKNDTFYQQKTDENLDAFFQSIMAVLVFSMQFGFAFLEAGLVRSKNTTNIIFKNVYDSLFCVLCYWSLGWGFAYGPAGDNFLSKFVGQSQWFLAGFNNYPRFFFQYIFAATATTIVGGALAERCEDLCYFVYCCIISTFVYPIITHWCWSPVGWLNIGVPTSMGLHTTYLDFSGCGVVHVCGGTISLAAAWIAGPRIGRFGKNGDPRDIKGHSAPFAALGAFLLVFGFLAFNGASTGNITKPGVGNIVALAMFVTVLSGAFAAFTALIIVYIQRGKLSLLYTINAYLAGIVASCAGCDYSDPWTAVVTGSGAALIYLGLSKLMLKLQIDDPVDAFALHFGGGSWGLLSTCLLRHDGIIPALLFGGNVYHAFMQLAWETVCWLSIIVWSLVWMVPIFLFLKKIGKVRVPPEIEVKGLDLYKHGEAAYPVYAYGDGWGEVAEVGNQKENILSMEQLASTLASEVTIPKKDRKSRSFYKKFMVLEQPAYQIHAKIPSKHSSHPVQFCVVPGESSPEAQTKH